MEERRKNVAPCWFQVSVVARCMKLVACLCSTQARNILVITSRHQARVISVTGDFSLSTSSTTIFSLVSFLSMCNRIWSRRHDRNCQFIHLSFVVSMIGHEILINIFGRNLGVIFPGFTKYCSIYT